MRLYKTMSVKLFNLLEIGRVYIMCILKNLKLIILVCSLTLANIAYAKNVPPWITAKQVNENNANSYYYYFDSDTLRTALIRIAKSFDVKIHFSDEIPDDTLNQMLSGRFRVSSPEELFNKFGDNFAITWFYYDGILYITSNNFVTKNLYVAPDLLANFKNVLANDGIIDDRFSWTEVPSEGMVVVSGPRDYISILEKKMKKLHISPIDQQFALFHLKYASAVDTTIQLSNQQLVIPGVATILKTLLQGGQSDSSIGASSKLLKQVVEPLKNNLKGLLPKTDSSDDGSQNISMSEGQNRDRLKTTVSSPVIQADNRLNTIIIRDKSNNMSIYKSLIDMLDVPAPLIQIEVLILDVDQIKMNEAGVSWWGNAGGGINGGFGSNNLNSSPQAGAPSLLASYGNISPGNLIVNNLQTFLASLRFLENKGYAKAESKSAVVTIDNIAAVVNLSQTFYPVANLQNQGKQDSMQTQIQMQVTPHVVYEDNNKKKLKLTVSLKDGNVEEKTASGIPSTLQGELNSQAIIEEGSSLLLAGFTHKQTEETENKVPVLGDIPILGWFFKSKSSENRELQRTYLVSPTIVWQDRNKKVPNYSLLNHKGEKEH